MLNLEYKNAYDDVTAYSSLFGVGFVYLQFSSYGRIDVGEGDCAGFMSVHRDHGRLSRKRQPTEPPPLGVPV